MMQSIRIESVPAIVTALQKVAIVGAALLLLPAIVLGSTRTTVVSDDFTRASLGSAWHQINPNWGQVNLSAGEFFGPTATTNRQAARWIGGSVESDQFASVEIKSLGYWAGDYAIGVIGRASADVDGGRDYYAAEIQSDSLGPTYTTRLVKVVNGVTTVLHSAPVAWQVGDRIELEVEGTQLRVLKNGTPLGGLFTATDTSLSSGSVGILASGNPGTIQGDNFIAGNLSPGGAQIAYVQGTSGTATSATSVTLSLGSPQTAGNLNVVAIGWNDTTANVVSVTDTKGNVYLPAVGPTTIPGTASLSIYYAKNIQPAAANGNFITVQFDQAASYPDFRIAEYSGIDTTDPLDAVAGASGTGTQLSSGTATTTSANTLLIGANYIQTGTNGVGAGFTQRLFTGWSHILADRIVASAGPYEATASQYGDGWWLMQMAAFKAAPSGGGGGNPQAPLTMGVTTVFPSSDSGNGNYLSVQQATLTQTATIQSISFYVNSPAGSLRLGVYDATGPSGGPGNKVAETNSFTTVAGWNTANVIAPVQLSAGTYWLAHLPSSSSLSYPIQWYSGTAYAFSYTFGPMPGAYGTSHSFYPVNWSIYATLTASGDAQAPTVPSNPVATAVSSTQIDVSWAASTDDVGVTGYLVERCSGAACTSFAQIATPTTTSLSDTGLTASTSYSYRVRATDAANNLSGYSSTASATTPSAPDSEAPSTPSGLSVLPVSSAEMSLSWAASTDNVAVTSYLIERCAGVGCAAFSQIATASSTNYSDVGLNASTSYSYRVRATDAANNASAYSNTATATTPAIPDTQAPTAPSGLIASPVSSTQINLTWTVSTDDVGVTEYLIERCAGSGCTLFTEISLSTSAAYNDSGLTAATSYSYRVRAADQAGNLSGYSNIADASTPTPPLVTYTYTYDALGRLVHVSGTDGSSIDYQYDANGNVTTIDRQ